MAASLWPFHLRHSFFVFFYYNHFFKNFRSYFRCKQTEAKMMIYFIFWSLSMSVYIIFFILLLSIELVSILFQVFSQKEIKTLMQLSILSFSFQGRWWWSRVFRWATRVTFTWTYWWNWSVDWGTSKKCKFNLSNRPLF